MLFYFSPTCSHCQDAIVQVQAFSGKIRSDGYETAAIAVQRSTQVEIQEFITKYKCNLPIFWDEDRQFGGTYDLQVLPTLMLVRIDGSYIRLDNYAGQATLDYLKQNL